MQGNLYLLACALIWGVAFIFQKGVTDDLDALTFNAFRFAIASAALAVLFLLPKRLFAPTKTSIDNGIDLRPKLLRHKHSDLLVGAIAGLTMFFGISLQQWGLELTTAGKSGFITSLYIVAVPILGLFIGQRCGREIVFAVLLAVVGFYFIGRDDMLALGGGILSGLNQGDWLTLITIFFWGIQVIVLGLGAKEGNLLVIATTQFVVVTVLSVLGLVIFFALGKLHWVGFDVLWKHRDAFVFTGVISTSVAFMMQLFGQKTVPTANAALILSLEGVFAAIAGVIFLNEAMTLNIFTGFIIIFVAVLLAQWRDILPLIKRLRP